MVRLSFGEIVVILGVLVVVFGARTNAVQKATRHIGDPNKRWSPAVVAFVFALLLGGGFVFVRGIGLLLRMVAR